MAEIKRKLHNRLNYILFLAGGKKPWSRGYSEYKWQEIKKSIYDKYFTIDNLPQGYGFRIDERIVEYPWLFSRLPVGEGKLLDAGSALNFPIILNHNIFTDKKVFISTLFPENICLWKKGISYFFEDLRESCFKDNYFDYIVCLSTLEHVGLDNTFIYTDDNRKNENDENAYLLCIKELKRILKSDGILYLTFPFGKHINYGWFQIFDRGMLDNIIKKFEPIRYHEDFFKYEPYGWINSKWEECCNATCFDIHKQKKYEPDFAAFSRAIACMELVKC